MSEIIFKVIVLTQEKEWISSLILFFLIVSKMLHWKGIGIKLNLDFSFQYWETQKQF